MNRILVFAFACLLAACQSSSPGSSKVEGAALSALIVGKTVILPDGGRITYGADGSYSYADAREQSAGRYEIKGGKVCATFATGFTRCDGYTQDGGAYYLVNGQGMRFKVSFG